MKPEPQVVTSLGVSPEQERRSRMIRYSIAMSVRVICIIVGVFSSGWIMWIAFAGAIFLPYFAVVIANAADHDHKGPQPTKVVAPTLRISADAFKVQDHPADQPRQPE